MTLATLKELVDSCDKIGKNSGLDIPQEVLDDFVRTIQNIITTEVIAQHYGRESLETAGPIYIPDETEVKLETLLRVSKEIEHCGSEDKIYANFCAILKTEEEVYIFEEIEEIYDSLGNEGVIKQIAIEDLFNKVSKESPLYRLLELLNQGKNITDSMMEVFGIHGIDIIKNPIVKLPEDVENFLNMFKNHMLGLITRGNTNSYAHTGSTALN